MSGSWEIRWHRMVSGYVDELMFVACFFLSFVWPLISMELPHTLCPAPAYDHVTKLLSPGVFVHPTPSTASNDKKTKIMSSE